MAVDELRGRENSGKGGRKPKTRFARLKNLKSIN
jgi:hypothetical protein